MSAYGEALRSTTTNMDELKKLTENLTESQKANVLASKKLIQTEAGEIVSKTASASATGLATFSMQAYTTAILANAKAMLFAIATNPLTWIVGIVAGIGFAINKYNEWNVTLEEHKEQLESEKQEYSNLLDELKSLDTELKNNDKTISELQKKYDSGTISLVEEDQLKKLKIQNDLLREQYETKKNIAIQDAKNLSKDNRETFSKEFGSNVNDELQENSYMYHTYGARILDGEDLNNKDLILSIEALYTGIDNAITAGDEESAESLQEGQDYLVEILKGRSGDILTELLKYQDTLSLLMNDDGTFDNELDQQDWDNIESWKKKIYQLIGESGAWNTLEIKTALDNESLQNLQSELKARLDAGDLTEEDLAGFTDLNTALSEANLILENGQSIASVFLQYLLGIAASQDDVTTTKPNYFVLGEKENTALDTFQEKISKVKEALQGLDNKTISLDDVINISQEMGLNVNEIDMLSDSYEGLRGQLEQILALEYNNLQEKLKGLLDTGEIDQDTYNQLSNGLTLLMLSSKNTNKEISSLSDGMSNLQSNFNSLTDAEREYEKTGKLSYETIQALSSAYPELEQELMNYLSGITTGETIIENLKESYDADLLNYKAYYAEKHKNDLDFYNQILENVPENIKARFEEYKFDLENYKSLAEAKLQIEKNLADEIYKQKLRENDRPIVKPWVNENYMFNEPEDPAVLRKEAEEEAEELSSALDKGVELTITLPKIIYTGNDDSGSDTETIEEIDWAANSIENLTNKINSLNTAIENASGYKKQLELIDQLITEEKNLLGLKERVKDEYSTRYTNSLSALSESESAKYKPLIESNTAISLEMFKGENRQEVFEKVKAAQEAWQAYQQALVDYEEQVGAVADAQDLKYETKADRIQGRIDRHSNNAQDIQNKIDLQTAKNGYADEQSYQDLIDENDKMLKDYDDKLELAKKKRDKALKKHGKNSEAYVNADNAVQDVEDNISSLKQEQIELNREVLRYPVHQLEIEKELLEEQLELVQEKKEKISDSISAASELVQGQIDYYQDLKETTSDSYDAQIKDIQKQKDALTETNDALQQQISLEKARYNLDRAMSQKTVKILRDGEFVYEADVDAIMDAQEALEQEQYNMAVSSFDTKIKNLEDEKQEALDVIDVQIESLTTYKENIDNIVSGYEQVLRLQSLISMFGQDAAQRVLSGDMSIVQEMGNDYIDTASTEKTLQEGIELYADEIEAVEKYALAWAGSKTKIEVAKQQIEDILKDTEEELKAIGVRNDATKSVATEWNTTQLGISTELGLIENGQTIAKDNEATILEKRLETLKAFAVEAKGYLDEVASALASAEQLQAKFNNKNKRFLNTGVGVLLDALNQPPPKFHTGMENGFVGEKNSQDSFKHISLTKLKPDEIPAILQVGEGVLTKLQQTNVLDNMRTAFLAGAKLPNFNNIQKANNTTSAPSITLNGDIVLQGVNDTTEFAKKIKSEFLTKLSQELYK